MEEGITLSVCTSLINRAEHNGHKCAIEELGVRRNVSVVGWAGDSPPITGAAVWLKEVCDTLIRLNRSLLAMLR